MINSSVVGLGILPAGGAVTNLCFCAYLFRKNSTWPKFRQTGALSLQGLAVLMGLSSWPPDHHLQTINEASSARADGMLRKCWCFLLGFTGR